MKFKLNPKTVILMLICQMICINLACDANDVMHVTWFGGKFYSCLETNQRRVPLVIEPSYEKLTSNSLLNRYFITVKVRLDKADSLYKQGERFVLGHSMNAGVVSNGDSIEYSEPDYAILDDNSTEATFRFKIVKGNTNAFFNVSLGGGRIDSLYNNLPAHRYKSASFKTDHSISAHVSFKLLKIVSGK